MLTIKSNSNNCTLTYRELDATIISTGETIQDDIVIRVKNHNLRSNDTIIFRRKDGSLINYEYERPVDSIIDKDTFTIAGFGEFPIVLNNYERVTLHNPLTDRNSVYLRLELSVYSPHIYLRNMDDIKTVGIYTWNNEEGEYAYYGKENLCDDDYVNYDDIFLMHPSGDTLLNIDNLELNVLYSGATLSLSNCLVPVNYINVYGNDINTVDNIYTIYVPRRGNSWFVDNIDELYGNISISGDDTRFLYKDEEHIGKYGTALTQETRIFKEEGNLEIEFGIGQDFDINLFNEIQGQNYADSIAEKNVNKIIDYERYPYIPMYYSGKISYKQDLGDGTFSSITADEFFIISGDTIDDYLKPVSKLHFRLNFRQREYNVTYNGTEVDCSGETHNIVDDIDYGTWKTNDSLYWNNYVLNDDYTALKPVYKDCGIKADLLGFLGFTDDDVYYQKSALKESFIRLSFYDSPNRETQKLLYYSTVYFDTNVMAKNYIRALNKWRENSCYHPKFVVNNTDIAFIDQLVYAYDIRKAGGNKEGITPIVAEMSCTDKYDNSSSSDGFYLHLFDKLVSGNTTTAIYMKVEFNNAKFGKTVPLTRPVYSDSNKPINPENKEFPRDYMEKNGVDMESFITDSYIKILIKYDFKTNNFVWFLPLASESDTIVFDLFEPRINGYDSGSYLSINDEGIGYGTEDNKPNWFTGEFDNTGTDLIWVENIDGRYYSEQDSPYTQDCCSLQTTVSKLHGESLLKESKLFNKSAIKKIKSIWVDGMRICDEAHYDAETGTYISTDIQLPDIEFNATDINGESVQWNPETTTEVWDDSNEIWRNDENVKPKVIHRVNYYFKDNTTDSTELFDELYLGTKNKKDSTKRNLKTIETNRELVDEIKTGIDTISNGQTLPNGMFANINNLNSVKFVKNGEYKFTIAGNAAFDNCKNLKKVTIEKDALDIIGKNCFCGCGKLKSAEVTNVQVILKQAFQGCYTLKRVYFTVGEESKLKYIGNAAFGYTSLGKVVIPNTVKRIANSAFRRCYKMSYIKVGEKDFNNEITKYNYLYGFNTYYDNDTLIVGDPDLYTFEDGVEYDVNFEVGKRLFSDNTISKYNFDRHDGKYRYIGGINDFILYMEEKNTKVKFYDAYSKREISLIVDADKDRGKLLEHFGSDKYEKYLNTIGRGRVVQTFGKWYNGGKL